MRHRGISAAEQDGTAAADYRNYNADIKKIKCKAEYLGGKIQRDPLMALNQGLEINHNCYRLCIEQVYYALKQSALLSTYVNVNYLLSDNVASDFFPLVALRENPALLSLLCDPYVFQIM